MSVSSSPITSPWLPTARSAWTRCSTALSRNSSRRTTSAVRADSPPRSPYGRPYHRGQCFLQDDQGACRIGVQLGPTFRYQALEARGIQLVGGHHHAVSVALSQDLASQLLPEEGDIALQGGFGGVRWLTRPDGFDEGVLGDHPVGVRQQDRQHHPLPVSPEGPGHSSLDRS